jgi:HK97 family phage prohead protease
MSYPREYTAGGKSEIRRLDFPAEFRFQDGTTTGPATIGGHAAVFDQIVTLYEGFQERIARGAFVDSIRSDDPVFLTNHNADQIIGRKSAGTLRLWEDLVGLAFELIPTANTQAVRDLIENVRARNILGCSFGFVVIDQEWTEDSSGKILRTIKKVKLLDCSAVVFPAYPTTDIGLKSGQQPTEQSKIRDLHRRLDLLEKAG